MAKKHLICTIIAPNYLSQAISLGRSLAQHMPDVAYRILVLKDSSDNSPIQQILESKDYKKEQNINHSVMSLQEVDWLSFDLLGAINKYDLLEFATSVKPALLRSLLLEGWERVTYLDPDIQVFKGFTELLSSAESISLTPHILSDYPIDEKLPNQQSILYAGTYNLGFISCTQAAKDFLDWWAWKLENFCTLEIREGYHVDQRWVDWAPAFAKTQIIHEPGLNVAYWNLHERSIKRTKDHYQVFVDDNFSPLYFFHFSGFSDFKNFHLSKHLTRVFSGEIIPNKIISEYAQLRIWADQLIAQSEITAGPITSSWTLGARISARALAEPLRKSLLARERKVLSPINKSHRFSQTQGQLEFGGSRLSSASIGWLLLLAYSRKQILGLRPRDLARVDDLGFSHEQIESGAEYARQVLSKLPRLTIIGYFAAPTGVGEIARNTAVLLARHGFEFTIDIVATQFDSPALLKQVQSQYLSVTGTEEVSISFINADMWPNDGFGNNGITVNTSYVGAVWAWEIEAVPDYFKVEARSIDQLFALSSFSARAIEKAIGKSVKVFPTFCADLTFPSNSGESIFELQKIYPRLASKYVLCRFDAKSVIARKNPEGVISTWRTICQEFPDYQLVIKAIDLEKNASQELLELIRNTPRVLLIDEAVTPQINDALTSNARCYISLHRAEGLGLNILEAIFADVPAVFTNYSGLADELVGIGFAVDYQLTKIGNDAGPYPSDGLWAEPDLEHASKQLRAALNQVESGAWLNNQGSRSKFVGDFLQVNSATAIALVAQMMESVSLIERKFPLQSHLQFKDSRNVFLLKVHAFFKPAWSLLPLNLRIRLNQLILKIATAFIKE